MDRRSNLAIHRRGLYGRLPGAVWYGGGDVTHQQAAGRQLVRHAAALAPVTSAAAAASDVCCCTTSIFCNRTICVDVYTKTHKYRKIDCHQLYAERLVMVSFICPHVSGGPLTCGWYCSVCEASCTLVYSQHPSPPRTDHSPRTVLMSLERAHGLLTNIHLLTCPRIPHMRVRLNGIRIKKLIQPKMKLVFFG